MTSYFKIRQEQIDVLALRQRQQFENRLTKYIEQSYPEEVFELDMQSLRNRVHRAVEQALLYGIEEDRDVSIFTGWAFMLGDRFELAEDFSWALEILRDTLLEGSEKVREIEEKLEEFEEDIAESDEDLSDGLDHEDVEADDPEFKEFDLPDLNESESEELG